MVNSICLKITKRTNIPFVEKAYSNKRIAFGHIVRSLLITDTRSCRFAFTFCHDHDSNVRWVYPTCCETVTTVDSNVTWIVVACHFSGTGDDQKAYWVKSWVKWSEMIEDVFIKILTMHWLKHFQRYCNTPLHHYRIQVQR